MHWMLDTGYRILVAGYWLLIIDYYLFLGLCLCLLFFAFAFVFVFCCSMHGVRYFQGWFDINKVGNICCY
jgi:hypothetical protein